MDREIQALLKQLQEMTNKAVKLLQKGDKKQASFFFNLAASITSQLSEAVKK